MSKVLKIVLPAVFLIVGIWFLLGRSAISRDPNWPTTIYRANTPISMIRVYDAESGTTLFWHHSDPDAQPVRIEKPDANHWIVVFEKVPK
jgi:hypothetical protein